MKVRESWESTAPFLVYSTVKSWKYKDLSLNVSDMGSLEKAIEEAASEQNMDLNIPFAFRIESTFNQITTHVVMPRSADILGYQPGKNQATYLFNNVRGILIGFYSRSHQQIFTHHDSFIHVHFVSSDLSNMGHVDEITLHHRTIQVGFPEK